MPYLPFFYEVPYLYLLQGAFTIWMLVDCHRRRAENHWFWVILFFPGFGAWIYFFMFKAKEFRRFKGFHFWPFYSQPSLKELRYRVQQLPTQANQMELADRLMEQHEYVEPIPHLESALKKEPDYGPALYSLALCQIETNQADQAIGHLERIIRRDPRWNHYRAWHLLCEARFRAGDKGGAVATCEELVRLSPTLEHQCLLAETLWKSGRTTEANTVIEKGLEDFSFAPNSLRWRERPWANKARRLQKQIAKESKNHLPG